MYDFVIHAFLFMGALTGAIIFVLAYIVAIVFVCHEAYVIFDSLKTDNQEENTQ